MSTGEGTMLFLTTRPLWLSVLIIVVPPTLLAMAGPYLIRRRVTLTKLRTNNEVAGFKFATVGVMYAVLLAFAVIVVWEKFSDAENDVAREAGAAATIYRLADGLAGEARTTIHDSLTAFLKLVVEEDWPAMERGEASPAATRALGGVYRAVLGYSPDDARGVALLSELLHQLNSLTEARRARLVLASGIVPGIIWVVLFAGALLTIGFTLFFGTENLPAQTLMTGMLSVLIFSGLLIIVAIDHPFAGSASVHPEALTAVLNDLGGSAARP